MHKESDNEILSNFDLVINRYAQPVYAFVFRLTGNASDAQDISQETFIKVWKNIKRFDSKKGASLKTWIFTIARNTATDWLRKKRPLVFSSIKNTESEDDERQFEDTLRDEEPLADEALANKQEKDAWFAELSNAISSLKEIDQSILQLHQYEELTFEEVSHVLDMPMQTVKSRYRRALHKLHQIINTNV